jgi:DNA-binding transcriptional MerR regulator
MIASDASSNGHVDPDFTRHGRGDRPMDQDPVISGPRTKSALALLERRQRRDDRRHRPAPEAHPKAVVVAPASPPPPKRTFAATISEVGERLGLSHRAIRLYEEMGLIACTRGPKNMRVLDAEAQAKLQVVVDLKAVGLTISEIAEVFSRELADPQALRARIEARLETLDRQRAAITDFLLRLPAPDETTIQGVQ